MSIPVTQPRLALALATMISLALATALGACRDDDTIRTTGNASLIPPPDFRAGIDKPFNERINLTWRAVTGADYYRLYRLIPGEGAISTAAGGEEIACGAFGSDKDTTLIPAECGDAAAPVSMMASSDCFGRSDAHNSSVGCFMFSDTDVTPDSFFIYSVYMCVNEADTNKDSDNGSNRELSVRDNDEVALKPGELDEKGNPYQCFTIEGSASLAISVSQNQP
ncbi:MAG: hypothetical protein K0U66_09530 [Gammaproteobacteria bacterium]|nr:hypothetical protein [Gammaproteobacteria bacterium]